MVNIEYALCVLCCQSGRRGHRVAAMNGDDFLVGFEAAAKEISKAGISHCDVCCRTYAPPELSDPAMTSIRLSFFLDCSMASTLLLVSTSTLEASSESAPHSPRKSSIATIVCCQMHG